MKPGARSLESFFGPLELRVLDALWSRPREASVRELLEHVPGIAYTTLMTTLDRLYKKSVLGRRRSGRAFLYAPLQSREGLEASLAAKTVDAIVASLSGPGALRPVLTTFVDAISRSDVLALDQLAEALERRRRELRRNERRG